jgi:NAD(P)-dependent dehydrogenase (short-subunit alcohol dehydrogenase family)
MSTSFGTTGSKVWFVTDANRGMGAAIARAALTAGCRVVAAARRPESVTEALGTADNLLPVPLDVTSLEQVTAAVRAAKDRFGRIDVLVNNAGYGQLGVFEESSLEDARAQFDTNVLGLMAVTHAVIPGMREQQSGRVFNISSIAGLKATFGASIYAASKFSEEGFPQALAEELAPFGVYVTSVAPGYFRTDFLDASSVRYGAARIPDYSERMAQFRADAEATNHAQAGDPAKLGAVLVHLAEIEHRLQRSWPALMQCSGRRPPYGSDRRRSRPGANFPAAPMALANDRSSHEKKDATTSTIQDSRALSRREVFSCSPSERS